MSNDTRKTFTGILVNVSKSMEKNKPGGNPKTPWIHSIFKVLDNLIKCDVSPHNRVFTIGFGASDGSTTEVFDVIGTIDSIKCKLDPYRIMSHAERVKEIMSILENEGAGYLRKWIRNENQVCALSSEYDSAMFLYMLITDDDFTRRYVNDCLPRVCREGTVTGIKRASFTDIHNVIQKAKHIVKNNLDRVTNNSLFDVHEASSILRGGIGEKELTDKRVRDLSEFIEPHVDGCTPLFSALRYAVRLFSDIKDHKNLLFLLSDGELTDDVDYDAFKQLRNADVTVVCCYITRHSLTEPLRLYDKHGIRENWENGAKFMFDLASVIPTQSLPRSLFTSRKSGRKWRIDFETNETRLFVDIHDVCYMAKDIVCSGDALSDMLASVDLDVYINKYSTCYTHQVQEKWTGGTCYAHASADVLHLAMKRILGRDGGYPGFSDLRDEMVEQYGSQGANTFDVLKTVCPKYRLQCREVDINGALEAVAAKRPVIANFCLTGDEWRRYESHYNNDYTRHEILSRHQVDISRRLPGTMTDGLGHAVVLTSFNSECLRFMDSWGLDWADDGFIRVENQNVLGMKFFDVFWEACDLSGKEKAYYKAHGLGIAFRLWESLKCLQRSTYKCPLCNRECSVTEFTGNIGRARCPGCLGEFKVADSGNILALNIYLTSIKQDFKCSTSVECGEGVRTSRWSNGSAQRCKLHFY